MMVQHQPHVEWLLTATAVEIFNWHSARSKADVVQSLVALIQALKDERAAQNRPEGA